MSYDVMVFDPSAAPRDLGGFRTWYARQTTWSEDHGYDDPAHTTPALAAWFHAMRQRFPALNGPHAADFEGDVDEERLGDYSIGASIIYVALGWSVADEAREIARTRAREVGVGFYDPSGDDGGPSADLVFP